MRSGTERDAREADEVKNKPEPSYGSLELGRVRRTHYDPLVELGVTVPLAESDFRVEGGLRDSCSREIGVGGDAPPGALTHPDSQVTPSALFAGYSRS